MEENKKQSIDEKKDERDEINKLIDLDIFDKFFPKKQSSSSSSSSMSE